MNADRPLIVDAETGKLEACSCGKPETESVFHCANIPCYRLVEISFDPILLPFVEAFTAACVNK